MQSENRTAQPEPANAPKRGFLEKASHFSQIIGSIAVVISLIYVGLQLQQNTAQLQRGENNATETQFQAIRLFIAGDRDAAEMISDGLSGQRVLDAADTLRLETLLSEFTWSTFHIWDRARRGLLDREEFVRGGAPNLAMLLCTARGGDWWRRTKMQFVAGFEADVDKAIRELPAERCLDYRSPSP